MHQRWFIHHLLKDILIASKFGQLWIEWLKHSWAGFLCEYSSQHLWVNIKKQDYSALWWNLPRSKPQYYGGGPLWLGPPKFLILRCVYMSLQQFIDWSSGSVPWHWFWLQFPLWVSALVMSSDSLFAFLSSLGGKSLPCVPLLFQSVQLFTCQDKVVTFKFLTFRTRNFEFFFYR